MKKSRLLTLMVLPFLSSCGGFSLNYIVEGNKYNSPVFTENYYEHWDSELKNAEKDSPIDVSENKITSFNEIGKVDKNLLIDNPYKSVREYARAYALMDVDSSFYYGVQSKLFDGEAYCDGYYQRHRVQSNGGGFSVRFQKESDELTYFAMQFKATTNNQIDCYPVDKYLPSYANDVGEDGDIYINARRENVGGIYYQWQYYVKKDGKWCKSTNNGVPNVMNCTEENANAVALYGTSNPNDSIGEENNLYVNTSNLNYYAKEAGSWVLKGTLLLNDVRQNARVYSCYSGPYNPTDHDIAIYHNSSFKINVSLYTKEASKIVNHQFVSDIAFDCDATNDGGAYKFFAFALDDYHLSRLVGFSVTFDNLNDDLINWNANKKIDGVDIPSIDYALFIYEVFLPYTYWH